MPLHNISENNLENHFENERVLALKMSQCEYKMV